MPRAASAWCAVRPVGSPEGAAAVAEFAQPAFPAPSPVLSPSESGVPGVPAAADPVALGVSKVRLANGSWQVTLTWTGGVAPYTVVGAGNGAFTSGVVTLGSGLAGPPFVWTGATVPAFFNVTDGSVVSKAVEGIGYDPAPAPTVPTPNLTTVWWGDEIQLSSSYLDPIAAANAAFMFDLPVRATSTDGGLPYASTATFAVPDDARTFLPVVQAHGRSSPINSGAPVTMSPPIPVVSTIRGVVWAPQNGHVWLAADGVVRRSDIFLRTPVVVDTITAFSKPYISKVAATGHFLVVDGVEGVGAVYAIAAGGGAPIWYASTKDGGFTRDIRPVGIAVDPDGLGCYIADALSGKVVKIPAGAGSGQTIVDGWGGRSFALPDPCGIDVNAGHQVLVASNDGWVYQLTGPVTAYADSNPGMDVHAIAIDRDSSGPGVVRYWTTTSPGLAEAFNLNPVGGAPRYHGAFVFGLASGRLAVDPHWGIYAKARSFHRVVLNNSAQAVAYPSPLQEADRIVRLQAQGWKGVAMRLRVIDPPDLAPYAPAGGWNAGGAVLPYEGNDNQGMTDYGLALSAGATEWTLALVAAPAGDDGVLTFYLKAPARYSGNNFQVEVTKCDVAGQVLPQRVAGLSGVVTAWKRVFVERDRMFRKGGLLYADFDPRVCGDVCNRIEVYDWHTAAVGDTVVVFDETNTAEHGGETRTIDAIASGSQSFTKVLVLNAPLTKRYRASSRRPPPDPQDPDFANLHSGGFGVVSGCDASWNQINAAGSCFFDADMRGLEQPFGDAFVEPLGVRRESASAPFVTPLVGLDADNIPVSGLFSRVWFGAFDSLGGSAPPWEARPQNLFHLVGVGTNTQTASGWSWAPSDFCFVSTGWIATNYGSLPEYVRQATVHEFGHMFRVNPCDADDHHDAHFAWCGQSEPLACYSSPPDYERCVMYENKSDPAWYVLILNDINRFCCSNLFGSAAAAYCGESACAGDEGIRNHADPE